MSKYLDRWMSTISGPVEGDVPDDLMALALELERRLAGRSSGDDEERIAVPKEPSRRLN